MESLHPQLRELIQMIRQGVKPVIEFVNPDPDIFDFENGMRTRCIDVRSLGDDCWRIGADFSEFIEFNQNLEQPNWYPSMGDSQKVKAAGNPQLLKWSQTRVYPADGQTSFVIGVGSEDQFKFVSAERLKIFHAYLQEAPKCSYVEWLENFFPCEWR